MSLLCPLCSVAVSTEALEGHLRYELRLPLLACLLCSHTFCDDADAHAHFQGPSAKHPGQTAEVIRRPEEPEKAGKLAELLRLARGGDGAVRERLCLCGRCRLLCRDESRPTQRQAPQGSELDTKEALHGFPTNMQSLAAVEKPDERVGLVEDFAHQGSESGDFREQGGIGEEAAEALEEPDTINSNGPEQYLEDGSDMEADPTGQADEAKGPPQTIWLNRKRILPPTHFKPPAKQGRKGRKKVHPCWASTGKGCFLTTDDGLWVQCNLVMGDRMCGYKLRISSAQSTNMHCHIGSHSKDNSRFVKDYMEAWKAFKDKGKAGPGPVNVAKNFHLRPC